MKRMIQNQKKGILFTIFILLAFELLLFSYGRNELAFYNSALLAVFIAAYFLSFKIKIPNLYLMGFVLVAALNALGGLVYIDGIRLYSYLFAGLFRLDMAIHFISIFFTTLLIYHALRIFRPSEKKSLLALISVFCAVGIGALFEVLELFGFVVFGFIEVEDYLNNAIDLASNLFGAIVALAVIMLKKH